MVLEIFRFTENDVQKKGMIVLGSLENYQHRLDGKFFGTDITRRTYLTEQKHQELLDILGRIEHGVYQ